MKKLFATLIVIVMVLALTVCLCACGGGNEPQQPQGPQEPQEQNPPVSQEITFDDNVTSSQEVVTVAKQEMSKRYESDTKSLTAEQKSFVEIIYLTIENQLENISGDAESAKTQCNALYKQLIDAVATVKKHRMISIAT